MVLKFLNHKAYYIAKIIITQDTVTVITDTVFYVTVFTVMELCF